MSLECLPDHLPRERLRPPRFESPGPQQLLVLNLGAHWMSTLGAYITEESAQYQTSGHYVDAVDFSKKFDSKAAHGLRSLRSHTSQGWEQHYSGVPRGLARDFGLGLSSMNPFFLILEVSGRQLLLEIHRAHCAPKWIRLESTREALKDVLECLHQGQAVSGLNYGYQSPSNFSMLSQGISRLPCNPCASCMLMHRHSPYYYV